MKTKMKYLLIFPLAVFGSIAADAPMTTSSDAAEVLQRFHQSVTDAMTTKTTIDAWQISWVRNPITRQPVVKTKIKKNGRRIISAKTLNGTRVRLFYSPQNSFERLKIRTKPSAIQICTGLGRLIGGMIKRAGAAKGGAIGRGLEKLGGALIPGKQETVEPFRLDGSPIIAYHTQGAARRYKIVYNSIGVPYRVIASTVGVRKFRRALLEAKNSEHSAIQLYEILTLLGYLASPPPATARDAYARLGVLGSMEVLGNAFSRTARPLSLLLPPEPQSSYSQPPSVPVVYQNRWSGIRHLSFHQGALAQCFLRSMPFR